MPRAIDEIAADFDALTERDFEYTSIGPAGWDRLDRLCDEMRVLNAPDLAAPVLFRTMERLDGVDDLGSPGPLVHTLETWPGRYERFLRESIRRKPTLLTVWMVNRILNTQLANADEWLELLRSVSGHLLASANTKASALMFLE